MQVDHPDPNKMTQDKRANGEVIALTQQPQEKKSFKEDLGSKGCQTKRRPADSSGDYDLPLALGIR